MATDNHQQEAVEIEERDDSAKNKGRNAVEEEVSPLGQRVINAPLDSFTASAQSQIIDQHSMEEAENSPIVEQNIAAAEQEAETSD